MPEIHAQAPIVLVAEDDFVFRTKIVSLLSTAGYQVVEAPDGKQAWELFSLSENRAEFSLVLTDLRMPEMNGLGLVDKIRTQVPEMPVVVFTAFGDKEAMKAAIRLGVKDFFEKPVSNTHEFLQRVAALIEDASWDLRRRLAQVEVNPNETEGSEATLTPREKQILQLTLEGLTSAESAKICGISRRTVEVHRANLLRKLGLRSTHDLFRYAVKNGLI